MATLCLQKSGRKATLMLSVLSIQGVARLLTSRKAAMGRRLHSHLIEYTNQLCASNPLVSTFGADIPLLPIPNALSVSLHPSAVISLNPNTSLGRMLASQVAQYKQSPKSLLPLPPLLGESGPAYASSPRLLESKPVLVTDKPAVKKPFVPTLHQSYPAHATQYLSPSHLLYTATPSPPAQYTAQPATWVVPAESQRWISTPMQLSRQMPVQPMQYSLLSAPLHGYTLMMQDAFLPIQLQKPWQTNSMFMLPPPETMFCDAQSDMQQYQHQLQVPLHHGYAPIPMLPPTY